MKPLNLLLTGAIAAAAFSSSQAATTITIDDAFAADDPAHSMSVTYELVSGGYGLLVTFTADNIGTGYVDSVRLNVPLGYDVDAIGFYPATVEAGAFQVPIPRANEDTYVGPNGNNQGIFDIKLGFENDGSQPDSVLFTEGDSVSFEIVHWDGEVTVEDFTAALDTPTDTWLVAASVTTDGDRSWYTTDGTLPIGGNNNQLPEPSTVLYGLMGAIATLARRKR